jgi:hypothetical protein
MAWTKLLEYSGGFVPSVFASFGSFVSLAFPATAAMIKIRDRNPKSANPCQAVRSCASLCVDTRRGEGVSLLSLIKANQAFSRKKRIVYFFGRREWEGAVN